MKLPIVHQLRSMLSRFSDRRSRRLSERAKKANRARYRRWLILGEPLEDRALLAGFTVSGSTLALNLTAANESVGIVSAGSTYAFVLTGGTWSGTDSADATGDGLATLTATAATFTDVTVDDSSTGNSAYFGNSGANTYSSSFNILLDDATAGAITFNGNTDFTGSAALSASTSRNITFNNLATLTSVSGDLTLSANQQAVGRDFADNGISVGPDVGLTTTSGNITLRGRGGVVNGYTGVSMASFSGTTVVGGNTTGNITIVGQGGGQSTNGVYTLRTNITTNGGNIELTGTGGTGAGASEGIYMDVHSFMKTAGAGNVSVTGIGGTGTSTNGIVIRGRTDAISAGTGTVTIFGDASRAAGSASSGVSFQNTPPFQLPGGVISSGNIIITGIGAPGALGLELNSGSPITTTGGSISLIADSMSIVGTVNAAAGDVNVRTYSHAGYIDLGSTTDGAADTLGLSNTELNNITANTLNIGGADTAVINVSTSIALNNVTTLNLIAGIINFNGNTISGATVNQTQGTLPFITVEQTSGTVIADGGTTAFGPVVQGGTRDLVFTIKNPGLGDLTGLDITIDGTNAAEFSVVASPTAPVAPGGSTTFTIRHASVATGTKTAALHIVSNVPGAKNPYDINLTANTLPDISVEQLAGTVIADGGTQGFGGVSVGSTADLVFTVKNPGIADLAISGITFDGTNASEFSVIAAPASSVPVGGSTTFTVRYWPTTVGSKTAALHIANNIPGAKNPYDINLTASSTPDITVEQLAGTVIADGGTQGFGGISVGSTADLIFTVKNPGTSGLTISDITFDGANASEFSVVAAPNTSVPVNDSTTFTVRYAPTTVGNKTAALHIVNNVPGAKNPYDINLTASSTPDITVEQLAGTIIADGGTQGFGGVSVGVTADLVFTVKNPGTSGLTISDITFDGENASEFSVFAAPTTSVPVNDSTTFTVRYAPVTVGSKTAALHIANNVPGAKNPYDINLTASSTPDISVEQASTVIADGGTKGFGTVVVGSTADLVFTVKNPGTSGLTISDITFDGENASEFSVFAAPTTSVPVSGSTTFTVRYAPLSGGNKTAALHIANNVPDAKNPYDINLTAYAPSAAPVSGTMSVGPTGFYSSLTQAITDIQGAGLSGAVVFELQPSYVSTVESFPLVFSNLGTTAVNTLTLRPATGATNLSISSANTTAATVDLNGAQFVTIDGRPGGVGSNAGSGVGTASQLTIANTSTSGVAVRFINEASRNTLRYTTLRGVNASAAGGVVVFSTTTGASGNDNNTIDHCDIREGASSPRNGIYSLGTTTTPAQANSGNTVSNCNIFNFVGATGVDSAGVRLEGGNTDWSITGNSLYQTATRSTVSANVRAIYINNTAGNNFTVTGNFIGGKAPNAGGTPWTTTGSAAGHFFQGIVLNVGTSTPSSVQGNTIANMVWTSNSTVSTLPGMWGGIYVQAGNVNVGTVTGNSIGSGTGTGSISVSTSGQGGTSFGIGSASIGTVAIANNTIGSITVNGSFTNVSASLTGIQVTAGTNTITGNTVGSTTSANSLNAATSSTSTTGQQVTGILSSSPTSTTITGNTVANLNNNYDSTNTAGQIRGIVTSAGVNTITDNIVRNLSTTSRNATPGITATVGQSVVGIAAISTAAGQTVSQNTVHSLVNTAASANVWVTGIYYAGPTSGTNIIARNFVHSLAASSTSATSVLNGMMLLTGTLTAQNNMVRVGLKADGTSTAGASSVRGILDGASTAGRNFYNNSVYVGGTQTSLAANTFSFFSSGESNARTFHNNIFVNARSNSGSTGKHYAVQYGGTTVNPTGLTAGGNIFLASGTGGVLSSYNNVDRITLALWQTATGQDATSFNVDPRFINPTGTADSVDLHLQTVNPAEAKGMAVAAVTDDFDGQARSSLTTVDIGADAGNFKYAASSTQLSPVVSFTPAANTNSTANRVLTGFATITDDVSMAGGGNAPRLYFKKSTEADAFGGNTSAANGWKFVTAGNASSPYNFTVNYGLLNSSVRGGDVIEYFVVAQDNAANFASSPSGAAYSSATAPVTTVNARPATVQSYRILSTDLSALTLSSGTLSPGFGANVTSYTATVANSVSSLFVTPRTADSTATVTVNGSTPASPLLLDIGANAITIVVTASDSATKTYTLSVTRAAANAAPTAVVLTPSSANMAESANTASATELSTITITDDGNGTNTLSLTGADAASFEIVSGKLRLKAGVTLDFETKSSYSVRVNVDDTTVGGTPDAFADFVLNITDMNEAPTATVLSPLSAILPENLNTSSAIELSTITIADDALGTNTLSLSGADAASFEIVASKLYLKAGVTLDYETKPSYSVTVDVDDPTVGSTPDASATFTLNLTNITELTGIDVQKGQTQRSFVRNVDILFDNDVGLSDLLSGNRVKLTRMDLNGLNRTAMTLPTTAVSGNQIQLDFGAQGIGGNRNSNAGDGYFEIAIDMDGDGSFESIKNFFRQYGDVTGDGIVDSRDKAQVLAMSGTTNVEGDLNGDGVVNLADTTAVSRAVGRKLKAGLTWDD